MPWVTKYILKYIHGIHTSVSGMLSVQVYNHCYVWLFLMILFGSTCSQYCTYFLNSPISQFLTFHSCFVEPNTHQSTNEMSKLFKSSMINFHYILCTNTPQGFYSYLSSMIFIINTNYIVFEWRYLIQTT